MHTNSKAQLIAFAFAAVATCGIYAQAPASDAKTPEKSTEAAAPAMKRVTGIGGVFLKAKDPAKLRAWYKTHLGIDVQKWGGASFRWVDAAGAPVNGKTAWFIGNGATFAPSESPFMINYRVADLAGLLKVLREEGCQVLDKVEESEFGSFGWVMDPEGNKVELWQPPKGQ
jgi:predicted enzyme related to lactoylglutathione lyase